MEPRISENTATNRRQEIDLTKELREVERPDIRPVNQDQDLAKELALLRRLTEKGKVEPFFEKMRFNGVVGKRLALAMLQCQGPNRASNASHIVSITRSINDGRWRLTHQGIAFDTAGKLRDGLHRVKAFLKSNTPVECWVYFGLDPEAFHNVDVDLLVRRAKHLISIAGLQHGSQCAATARLLAAAWNKGRDDESLMSLAVELDNDTKTGVDSAFMAAVKAGIRCKGKLPKTRPASMSAAYYMIAKNSQFADRLPLFWDKFVSGENINKTNPNVAAIYKLRTELTLGKHSKAENPGGGAGMEIGFKQAGAVILAWNAWVKRLHGRSLEWTGGTEFPGVE